MRTTSVGRCWPAAGPRRSTTTPSYPSTEAPGLYETSRPRRARRSTCGNPRRSNASDPHLDMDRSGAVAPLEFRAFDVEVGQEPVEPAGQGPGVAPSRARVA